MVIPVIIQQHVSSTDHSRILEHADKQLSDQYENAKRKKNNILDKNEDF